MFKIPELEYDYNKNFRKTFQGKEDAWKLYIKSVTKGDNHGVYCANNSVRKDRIMVDGLVFSTYSPDLDLWLQYLPKPYEIHSDEHIADLKFVADFVPKRDHLISDYKDSKCLPKGLREVSWFLRNVNQKGFVKGVDYLATEQELLHVYKGNKVKKPQLFENKKTPITTFRDAARFVRDDPAVHVWADWVVGDLLAEKVAVRHEIFVRDYKVDAQHDFSVIGGIDIKAIYWEAATRLSRLSFRTKHLYMYPRPEQAAWDLGIDLIPQAFDRGAPEGHGDFTAMHAILYFGLSELTQLIFDPLHVMSNGKTVKENCEVLAENGAYWRTVAGVHTMKANDSVKDLAIRIVRRIVNERLRLTKNLIITHV